jgi:hypothetical protein
MVAIRNNIAERMDFFLSAFFFSCIVFSSLFCTNRTQCQNCLWLVALSDAGCDGIYKKKTQASMAWQE